MITVSEIINNIETSATLEIRSRIYELKKEGLEIISFASGEPDFDTPVNIKNTAKVAIDEGFTKYTLVEGVIKLREAICDKFKKDNELEYNIDEVIVSNGSKQALYNSLRAICNERDEVIVPTPCWVTYPEQIKLAGAKPIFIATDEKNNFKLTPEELRKFVTQKTKGIIINNPNNPTGAVYSKRELNNIAEFAINNSLWIIVDEIYEKIIYDKQNHVSLASLSQEIKNKAIIINGLSKSHAMTGWRVGYAAGPANVIKAMKKLQGHSTASINSISQKAAIEALTGPQDFIQIMIKEYEKRRNKIIKILNDLSGVKCKKPEGAFYVFPDVRCLYGTNAEGFKIENEIDLAKYLLEEAHIAVVPGSSFHYPGYIRLSYATSMKNIEKGMEQMVKAIKKLKK